MGLHAREAPQEAFMKHLRDLFAALYIQERPRGRWLALLTEEEAKQIIKSSGTTALSGPRGQNVHDDDKVCLLTAPRRASRCNEAADVVRLPSGFSFEVVRERGI